RLDRADEAREPRRAAETRMQSEQHFGEAETCAFDGDPPLAGERHLQPATETKAVGHRDGDEGQRFQAVDHLMRAPDALLDRGRLLRTDKFADIGTGNEPRWLR